MLNMRVKNLGSKFVGVDRKEINQTIQNDNRTNKELPTTVTDDRNITLKKIMYFLQFKGLPVVFPFGITVNIHLNGSIMLWNLVEVY